VSRTLLGLRRYLRQCFETGFHEMEKKIAEVLEGFLEFFED
jgi:hypothetical protein